MYRLSGPESNNWAINPFDFPFFFNATGAPPILAVTASFRAPT
jgi:hypothetical protein